MCSNHPPVNMTASPSVHWFILARREVSVRFSQSLQIYFQLVTYCAALSVFCICFLVFIVFFLYVSADLLPSEKVFCPVKLWTVTCCISQLVSVAPHEAQKQRSLKKFTVFKVFHELLSRCSEPLFKVMMMLHDNSSVIHDEPRYGAAVTPSFFSFSINSFF